MPQIKHSWVWVVSIWALARCARSCSNGYNLNSTVLYLRHLSIARAQMGTTQTQLCFILGIWARFGIIYFLNKPRRLWLKIKHTKKKKKKRERETSITMLASSKRQSRDVHVIRVRLCAGDLGCYLVADMINILVKNESQDKSTDPRCTIWLFAVYSWKYISPLLRMSYYYTNVDFHGSAQIRHREMTRNSMTVSFPV